MKRLFIMGAAFLVFFHAFSPLNAFAYEAFKITKLDESSSELSIPPNIGIEIPEIQESVPVFGIILWALAAVIILAALIIIFTNGGSSVSQSSVRRNRYQRKKEKKNGKYSKYGE